MTFSQTSKMLLSLVVLLLANAGILVEGVNIKFLKTVLQDHFSENRHHAMNPQNKMAAMEFVHQTFENFGMETEYQTFKAPKLSPTQEFANVVGVLKGGNFGTQADKIIGIIAHYDTVKHTKGVDDNGSGVAAMLEVARQLKEHHGDQAFQHTIIFLSTDLEDEGHLGATKFISGWLKPWLAKNYGKDSLPDIRGFISMDTLMNYDASSNSQILPKGMQYVFPENYNSIVSGGSRGDFMPVVFRGDTKDGVLAHAFEAAWKGAGRPQFKFQSFSLPFSDRKHLLLFGDFVRSDHLEFWSAGIPAIYLTDSGNYRGVMNECYHHECDNLSTMMNKNNIQFLNKTSDAVSAMVASLAG